MQRKVSELYDILETLGVRVEFVDDLSDEDDGDYEHDARLIRIRHDLLFRRYVTTLAHETCHAIYSDVASRFGPVNAKQERRADEWAALFLIPLDEYRRQEARHDGHAEAMAISLGVTVELIETFRGLLFRHGNTVYVEPKMGAGAWRAKVEVA